MNEPSSVCVCGREKRLGVKKTKRTKQSPYSCYHTHTHTHTRCTTHHPVCVCLAVVFADSQKKQPNKKEKKKYYIIIREKMEPSTSICRALFFLEGKKKERKRGKLYVYTVTFSVTRPPVIRSQWSVEMAFLGTKVATFSTSHEVMTVHVFSLGLLFRFKKYNQFPLLRQNNTKRGEIYTFDAGFFSPLILLCVLFDKL